jgi:hypothetical protein
MLYSCAYLACAYIESGRLDDMRDRILDALRKAGLPEG